MLALLGDPAVDRSPPEPRGRAGEGPRQRFPDATLVPEPPQCCLMTASRSAPPLILALNASVTTLLGCLSKAEKIRLYDTKEGVNDTKGGVKFNNRRLGVFSIGCKSPTN